MSRKKIQIAKNLGLAGLFQICWCFILCKRFIGFKALNVSLVILSVKKMYLCKFINILI